MSLFRDKETELNEAFNSTSSYLDDLFNIHNTYFDGIVRAPSSEFVSSSIPS